MSDEIVVEDEVFKNDPLFLHSLIGKKVLVMTENKNFVGVVYVVDPIYKNIILHTNWQSENDYKVIVIFHQAIKKVSILSEESIVSYQISTERFPLDNDCQQIRKNIVKKWLVHMYLNVTETGDYLKINDHLIIVPPYGPDNCICNNTIVLDKIQKMLEFMPSDFK